MITAILKIVEMRLLKYLTKGEKNPSRKQCILHSVTNTTGSR
jgi:hypothetical protein